MKWGGAQPEDAVSCDISINEMEGSKSFTCCHYGRSAIFWLSVRRIFVLIPREAWRGLRCTAKLWGEFIWPSPDRGPLSVHQSHGPPTSPCRRLSRGMRTRRTPDQIGAGGRLICLARWRPPLLRGIWSQSRRLALSECSTHSTLDSGTQDCHCFIIDCFCILAWTFHFRHNIHHLVNILLSKVLI